MSASSISTGNLFSYENQSTENPNTTNNAEQFAQEFQQLGEDLQSGNLSAAQQDFVTLEQYAPQTSSTSSAQSSNPLAQAFNQLAQDLKSGNLSAAQQDFKTIQQDFQSQAASGHHHHHGGGSGSSQIGQLFDQLGEALQSGNLSSAQQLFATLQQDSQQSGQSTPTSSTQTSSAEPISISVSVSA